MTDADEQALIEASGVNNLDWEGVITLIGERFQPDDVFDADALNEWAKDNGWKQVEAD